MNLGVPAERMARVSSCLSCRRIVLGYSLGVDRAVLTFNPLKSDWEAIIEQLCLVQGLGQGFSPIGGELHQCYVHPVKGGGR